MPYLAMYGECREDLPKCLNSPAMAPACITDVFNTRRAKRPEEHYSRRLTHASIYERSELDAGPWDNRRPSCPAHAAGARGRDFVRKLYGRLCPQMAIISSGKRMSGCGLRT